jgi:hypothetical protein
VADSAPWHVRADPLARWALARLVNRLDAWGAYYGGGQVTKRGTLTHARIVRHFQGRDVGDIIGLHTAGADNRSKGGALDIDQHGDDPVRAEANRRAALHWHDVLIRLGFCPLLTASNGRGGYHLRILLGEPIDAARIFYFLRRLTADHRQHGFLRPPEQRPAQVDVRRCAKQLGSWLRLPGKHHKYLYWSAVYGAGEWLDDDDAIDHILALTGDDPALVPEVPPGPPATPKRSTPRRYPAGDNLSSRIAAYLRRLPNLAEGQGRDDVAFRFAAFLVRDLALADSTALDWLKRWDAGNSPPKGAERLAAILKNAHAYGQHAAGSGLPPPDAPRYDRHGHRILKVTAEVYA